MAPPITEGDVNDFRYLAAASRCPQRQAFLDDVDSGINQRCSNFLHASSGYPLFASLHALLIVSEAARKLGDAANALVPGQPWADIRSIGNVLRHEYDGVDPETVWRVIRGGDLAALREAVGSAVARLRGNASP